MNTQEKWNFIVERHRTNFSKPENVVQKEWEDMFSELFDYKKLLGEIVPHEQIQIGSSVRIIPDIFLEKDKVKIVDVELKQYNLSLNEKFENQLMSYLTFFHISIGVIVCTKLYLFWFEYESSTLTKIEIPFEKDNERGIKFVELFNRNTIDKDTVKKFIFSEKEKECEIAKIRNLLTSEFVRECVVEKLSKDFNRDVVNDVMNDFCFDVGQNKRTTIIEFNSESKISNNFNHKQTKEFVIKNTMSLSGLERGFDFYDLSGRKLGVIFSTCDKKNSPAYGKCEMRFYPQYEKEFGRYHRFKINGERLDFAILQTYLNTHNEKRIVID